MHNFQYLFCQSLYVHTILGIARGSVPLPIGKFCICKLFTHNFKPFFGLNLQKYIISGGHLWPPEIYNFWWSQGAAVLFIRECVFLGNHKCTISVPFLSKCLRMWLQGGAACLRKLSCKLVRIISGPFWSKFTEIYNFWWLRARGQPFIS